MSAHHAADQKTLVTQAEMSCAANFRGGTPVLCSRSCFVISLITVMSDDFDGCFHFPLQSAAAFNFQARLSCSAGMRSGRGAGSPYLGVRSPRRAAPWTWLIRRARQNEKGSRRIALSDRGKDQRCFFVSSTQALYRSLANGRRALSNETPDLGQRR